MTASSQQRAFPLFPDLKPVDDPDANYGAVYTRRWVVELILDLAGYDTGGDLASLRLVEPACGEGAFLIPIVDRLISSCEQSGASLAGMTGAIRAFDLQLSNVETSRKKVIARLLQAGLDLRQATQLAEAWIRHADFLLTPIEELSADFVVGNPPYIRLEDVSREQSGLYRQTCQTMTGRSDIFVGFYEIGLRLLNKQGRLAFICADRWMRNGYGKRLREMVANTYSMDVVIEMHDVDAFEESVSAYPAITVIRNASQGQAATVQAGRQFGPGHAHALTEWVQSAPPAGDVVNINGAATGACFAGWFDTSDSWPTGSPQRLALLRELESRFPSLEASGARVGIGVATGADDVFIVDDPEIVERDRTIPLLMSRDIAGGTIDWGGQYLVNPWQGRKALVDLDAHPRLAGYFDSKAAALRKRYVAGKRADHWYRTIDPVHEWLTGKPKLVIPDMKMTFHPVLDPGGFYPHHNLYYVTSDTWDLRVLGGILLSRVAQFFIESYAVRMRGGTLRFQAQYLRRIRIPSAELIGATMRDRLSAAFEGRDVDAATSACLELYGVESIPD